MKRNTRVRYVVQTDTGVLESTQSYLGKDGLLFKVYISKEETGYAIVVGAGDASIIKEGFKTLASAKVAAKLVLKEQGVMFYDDVRNRVKLEGV